MWTVIIFLMTYLGVAVGRIPGLALDRTGIALLGAIAMMVCGVVPLKQAMASIDVPTILLLYALMIVSAQLRLGGFYTRVALAITALSHRPRLFLLISMGVSAALSALLANDIVCLAFTPVLACALLRARLDPVPFLLGLAAASNIGSAATIIGNPQNMLIGQLGRLSFIDFMLWCTPPALMALAGSYAVILATYKGRWHLPEGAAVRIHTGDNGAQPAFNAWQSGKGLLAVCVLVILFFTPIARELSALAVAGILLCSRKMKSRSIISLVDWHLITLFCALFIVIEGFSAARMPEKLIAMLAQHHVDIQNGLVLTGVSTLLSNLVSNVPAVMLIVRFLNPAQPAQWYLLALASTFAGNLITIGSIANLIVFEQAERYGVHISFSAHARTGIPITLVSLIILVGWIYFQT